MTLERTFQPRSQLAKPCSQATVTDDPCPSVYPTGPLDLPGLPSSDAEEPQGLGCACQGRRPSPDPPPPAHSREGRGSERAVTHPESHSRSVAEPRRRLGSTCAAAGGANRGQSGKARVGPAALSPASTEVGGPRQPRCPGSVRSRLRSTGRAAAPGRDLQAAGPAFGRNGEAEMRP